MGSYGLGFALQGAQAGMDARRAEDIQDEELQHTRERRAIVEPMQDQAMGLQLKNAQDEAKYRAEDRPLERTAKENAVTAGGLQNEALKTSNKLQDINLNLARLHASEYSKESEIKSNDLRGQRIYGIAKLADMNPSLAIDVFNNMPETKASGVQAAWIGYATNSDDPKDKEKYLVAKDAKGNVINLKGPGGKPLPAVYKKSALDVYAPKFDQYDVKDGVLYNKYTGAVGGLGGMGHQASNDSWARAKSSWGMQGLNGEISFSGDNGKYASINARLTDQIRSQNQNMDVNSAHEQALAMTQAIKKRDEFQGDLPSDPTKAAASLTQLFPYGGTQDANSVRSFMSQHGIDQQADQDAVLQQLGVAANSDAASASTGTQGRNTRYVKAPRPANMSDSDLITQAKSSTAFQNNPKAVVQNLRDWGVSDQSMAQAGLISTTDLIPR